MFESFHWLLPNLQPPTWTDIIIAIAIVVVGFLVQRYILKPGIVFSGRFVRAKGSPVIADIIEQFSRAVRHAFMTVVVILSVSVHVRVDEKLFHIHHVLLCVQGHV